MPPPRPVGSEHAQVNFQRLSFMASHGLWQEHKNKVGTAISCVGSKFGQRFDSFKPPGLGLPFDRLQSSAPGSIHPQTLIKNKKKTKTTKETSLSMEMFRWAILEDAFLDEPLPRPIHCF